MKNLFLFCLILFSAGIVKAQSHLRWTNIESTPNMQINDLRHMSTDAGGNTFTIDFTQSNISYYVTYRFFCYNNRGVRQWQYDNDSCFTDCADKYFLTVPDGQGGALFIGTYDDLSGAFQIRVKHIDRNGKLAWQNNWTSSMIYGVPAAAQLDPHGDLVVGFKAVIRVADQQDFVIAKFDTATGNALWHYEMPDGGTAGASADEELTAMCIDHAGNIYAAGTAYYSAIGTQDNLLIKVKNTGGLAYSKTLWPGVSATLSKIASDGSDYLYAFGQTAPFSDTLQVRIEQHALVDGSLSWVRNLSHDSADIAAADFILTDNGLYTAYNYKYFVPDTGFSLGHFTDPGHKLTKIDFSGATQWEQEAPGTLVQLGACSDRYCSLTAIDDTDKSFLILTRADKDGHAQWSDSVGKDYANGMLSFDAACNVYLSRSAWQGLPRIGQFTQQFTDVPTGIGGPAVQAERLSVWPNPTRDALHIAYKAGTNSIACITDLSGRILIRVPMQGSQTSLSLAALAPGTYLLRVWNGTEQVQAQPIVKF